MKKLSDEIRQYFSELGKKGGAKSSPRKTKANKRNAQKRWEKEKKGVGK